MGELVDVVRILHIARSFSNRLHPFDTRILAASDVGNVIVALILNRSRRVDSPGGGIDVFEVLPGPGLIAHAPDQDAGMVVVGRDHLDHPGDMRVFPLYRMRQGRFPVTVMMALDVGLIHQVNPVLVAEIVPIRSVRIMGIPDMVDICPFHELDVLFHHLAGNGVTHRGLCLMTVHSTELHGFSIEIEILPGKAELIFRCGSVLDADLTEPDYCREYVKRLSGSVL